ncbi:MAG: aminomethyl-transferring glycine dehydrogenase subunit GcvPA [Deltaproteobacteria bacterium]|nr:aminomethyl-transferring glycine dehydrogenase subunit GcvPA [Deltaproteobacteria bacterium]
MRYIPHTEQDIREMCERIGIKNPDELFAVIPANLKLAKPLHLPAPLPEAKLVSYLKKLSRTNETVDSFDSFLGAGAYHHYVPVVISALTSRGEFLTAYTPYQPELSQGTLQALFEFQTMIASLLGMEVANASQYDGASSLAEALLMALRVRKRKKIIISEGIHPEYLQVVKTYLGNMDVEWVKLPINEQGRVDRYQLEKLIDDHTAAVCVQSPNFFGVIEDQPALIEIAHRKLALYISCFTESLAFGLLQPAGLMGADIVCGEGMSLGNYLNLGGPHLGLFTTRQEFVRQMPGRLVGETVDTQGKRGFVLTLSTREQHIRRQKATSNICTNQGLCALAATIYLALLGPGGIKKVAEMNYQHAHYLYQGLTALSGVKPKFSGPVFNEFVLELNKPVSEFLDYCQRQEIFAGVDMAPLNNKLKNCFLVCATEMNTKEQIDQYIEVAKEFLG